MEEDIRKEPLIENQNNNKTISFSASLQSIWFAGKGDGRDENRRQTENISTENWFHLDPWGANAQDSMTNQEKLFHNSTAPRFQSTRFLTVETSR